MKKTRRHFFLAAVLLALPLSASAIDGARIPSKPNIIILYADDLGYGDLACYNPKSPIPTPNLDALASRGMRFTDAHSSSGICTPSRYALLTGRHHWRDFHKIVNSFEPSVFPKGRLTIAGMLQSEGYRTAAMGKWHLGWNWDAIKTNDLPAPGGKEKKKKTVGVDDYDWSKRIPGGPLSVGFDHYFGEDVINFPPYCWIEDDKIVQAPDRMLKDWIWDPVKEGKPELRPGPMAPDWNPYEVVPKTTCHAVEFIKSRQEAKQPFFLYFAYPSPHAPIIPNKEFVGKSGAGPYGDYVVETDHSVGQILAALKEAGFENNTLVVFTSDNGPEYFAYERDAKLGHWSSQPLRGLKRDIYEGGHRLPFLVKWPGVVPEDSTCHGLISQVDLMATIAAVVGYKLPANAAEDSHDMLPLFQGGTDLVRETHVHNTFNSYAIRHGDWVLVDAKNGYSTSHGGKFDSDWNVRHGYPADDSHPAELYNLKEDIPQKKNLAAARPDKVEELRSLLKKIQQQGHSAPRLAVELGSDPDRILAGARSVWGHLAATCAFDLKFDTPGDNLTISTSPKALILFNPDIDNGPGSYGHQRVEPCWMDFLPPLNIPAKPPSSLFITGDKDTYTPTQTARKFQTEIEKQGARCNLVVLEGGKHGSPFEDRFFPTTLQAADAFPDRLGDTNPPRPN